MTAEGTVGALTCLLRKPRATDPSTRTKCIYDVTTSRILLVSWCVFRGVFAVRKTVCRIDMVHNNDTIPLRGREKEAKQGPSCCVEPS
jgi:hypothetical protein